MGRSNRHERVFPAHGEGLGGIAGAKRQAIRFHLEHIVYQDNSAPNFDETAALQTLKDPTSEEMGKNFENFGGGKALCEKAAEAAMPGRVTNIRPGYIVGARDTSGRFIYWPVRASMGGEMVVPGRAEDPIQIIDVRDLADWVVHCIEENTTGVYNATGPAKELSMKGMLQETRKGTGAEVAFTWIDYSFLVEHGVEGQFPLYAPPTGETAGFHRCNISRALGKGLKFRPVEDTAKATLRLVPEPAFRDPVAGRAPVCE